MTPKMEIRLLLVFGLCLSLTNGQEPMSVSLDPPKHVGIPKESQIPIRVTYHGPTPATLHARVADRLVAVVTPLKLSIPQGNSSSVHFVKVFGKQPGRTTLKVTIRTRDEALVTFLTKSVDISVVKHVELAQDYGLFVTGGTQVIGLCLLGFRVHPSALKAVLMYPRVLVVTAFNQVFLRPLVMLGISLSLGLQVHSFMAFLMLSCCPTSPLSPLLALLQHGRLDAAVLITVLQPLLAFGILPLWLYTCGQVLHLPYTMVWLPYWHVVAAFGIVCCPVLLGLLLQRVGPCKSLALPISRALHPFALLAVLTAVAANSYELWDNVQLVDWLMVTCSALLPLLLFVGGGLISAVFKQNLPTIKVISIVNGMQSITMASIIVRTSFSPSDGSLMAVTISCVGFASLSWMLLLYFAHVLLWVASQSYRNRHGDFLSAYQSLADHLVHSMIKAGEISLKPQPTSESPSLSQRALVSPNRSHGFNSLGFGNKVLDACRESLQQSSLAIPSLDTTNDSLSFTSSSSGKDGDSYEMFDRMSATHAKDSRVSSEEQDSSTSFTVSSCSDDVEYTFGQP